MEINSEMNEKKGCEGCYNAAILFHAPDATAIVYICIYI